MIQIPTGLARRAEKLSLFEKEGIGVKNPSFFVVYSKTRCEISVSTKGLPLFFCYGRHHNYYMVYGNEKPSYLFS